MELLQLRPEGIYCPLGDFYIDPWQPVPYALITHAHADHARPGHRLYVAHKKTAPILRLRLGENILVQEVEYGERLLHNGVEVSFHPAGHVIGSAQIRVAYRGQVWVVSGDFKIEHDGISSPFEPLRCHTFVTESTFGLPVFGWKPQHEIFQAINRWWHQNRVEGLISVLFGYSLGKAQRILCGVDSSIGQIYVHGAIANINQVLEGIGFSLPSWKHVQTNMKRKDLEGSLVLAPLSAVNTPWLNRFQPCSIAMASGWMQLRGNKRRQALDCGFVLSDHADWKGLLSAVSATGAERVLVTHGYAYAFSRYLQEKGIEAQAIETHFEGESPTSE